MKEAANRTFKVYHGERRVQYRSSFSKNTLVDLAFGDYKSAECELISVDFGRICIKLLDKNCLDIKNEKSISTLELYEKGGILHTNGNWELLKFSENEDSSVNITFVIKEFNKFFKLKSWLAPETLLKTNRYKIFQSHDENDLAALSEIFTDIKDCPLAIPCTIHHKGHSITCLFDFSSNLKSLDFIDLKFTDSPEGMQEQDEVTIEFQFQSTRYLFQTNLKEIDTDFELISIHFPTELLSTVSRQYDRNPCDIPITLICQDKRKIAGNLVEFSVTGGKIVFEENITKFQEESEFELHLHPLDSTIEIMPCNFGSNSIGFQFNTNNFKVLREIFLSCLPQNITYREKDNYGLFYDLFKEVGYAQEEDVDHKEKTQKAWSEQDKVLPGNSFGTIQDEQLVSSCSMIPFSKSAVYGHSYCMQKSLEGASGFLKQAILTLSWIQLIQDSKYFMGAYKIGSRLTARVHLSFNHCASPIDQYIINCNQILPQGSTSERKEDNFLLEILEDSSGLDLTPKHQKIIEILGQEAEAPLNLIKINNFLVKKNQVPYAVLISQSSDANSTASNMTNNLWVLFLSKCDDATELCEFIRSVDLFKSKRIQLTDVGLDAAPKYNGNEVLRPAFWTISHKDEIGVLIASLSKTFYSVLIKYGDDAKDKLTEIL